MVRILITLLLISNLVLSIEMIGSRHWNNSPNSSALGLAITAQTNHPDALFFNPAGLSTNKKSSININHSSFFQTDFSTFSLIGKFNDVSIGIGAHMSQSGQIEKTTYNEETKTIYSNGTYNYGYYTLYLGAAIQIPYLEWGFIGANMNIHQISIDQDSLKGDSISIGTLFTPFSFLSIGYRHSQILPLIMTWYGQDKINSRSLSPSHTVKQQSAIGLNIKLPTIAGTKVTLMSDYIVIDDNNKEPASLRLGTQLEFKTITLNMGYNDLYLSSGIKINLNQLSFNYSINIPNQAKNLSNRHGFGINYSF